MFKSLSLKIAMMFVLLTISIIILIGAFMTESIDRFYDNEFNNLMSLVFNEEYVQELNSSVDAGASAEEIYSNISVYISQLGVDSFRNLYLLDGLTGKTIDSLNTHEELAKSLEVSPNIISAISGKLGMGTVSGTGYMDYAVPLKDSDEVKYIIYVRDTKEETNNVMSSIFTIMIQALLIGLALSVLLSILLSKTIILPIQSLTNKASKLKEGDFDETIEVRSDDEIGQLTNTFNLMASELKETLHEIRSEKDKSETILLHMTDGVVAFNRLGELIHINPAAKELLKLEDTTSISFDTLFGGSTDISVEKILFLPHFKGAERSITTDTNELIVHFAPIKSNDIADGIIAVIQDITEQKRLDNSRREFVANVSHELRTPLTTVKSYAETLMDVTGDDNMDPDMFRSFLRIINNETDRMTRLVKDLLLLSRLDYSLRDMPKEAFDISKMIRALVDRLKITADEKKQSLIYEPTNTLPLYTGSIDRIEQVLINVITNAIKYTPQNGRILITTMYMYSYISIKVIDNGIGIPEESLEHIFERFYRVDKARSRDMGGTGLGLAIAKEIVEAHDGTIEIKSKPGSGTEVVINLPVQSEE
ncbi:MAG: HAMP domain-containing protein [Clostridia bacterium]|nr:HAMP domain-containing protein [Clostridia bacterium]